MEEQELAEKLEVKVFGAGKKLWARRTKLLEEHRKAKEKIDEDKDKLTEEDKSNIQKLLQS